MNKKEHRKRWIFGYPDGVPGTPEYEPAPLVCNSCNTVSSRHQKRKEVSHER